MARVCDKKCGLGNMGGHIAQNHHNHDDNTTDGTNDGEWDVLSEFVCYALAHCLFRQLGLFPVAAGAEARELGKVMFGMKAQIPGKLIFPLAQSLIGKFLNDATVLADHEAMASLSRAQATLHKSATG